MDAPGTGPLTEDVADAEARIRAAGLRVTRPRVAVLRLLARLGGHRSVEEIGAALASGGAPLPLTTVYNVVDDLTRAGLVMSADAGPGRALYEVAEGWHHHFVCRSCGRVLDVPCARGSAPCLAPDLAGVEVDEAAVIFRGRCERCVAGVAAGAAGEPAAG